MRSIYSFVVLAGEKTGLGHLNRTRVIRDSLERVGVPSNLFVVTSNGSIARDNEIRVNDVYQLSGILSSGVNNKIGYIDAPAHWIGMHRALFGSLFNKLIFINDEGELIPTKKENETIIACSVKFEETFDTTGVYNGSKYIILSSQYNAYQGEERRISKNVERVLLSFGGSDPNLVTAKVIRWFHDNKIGTTPLEIEVVLGRLTTDIPLELITQSFHRIRIHRDVTDMHRRLWQADLAIISGGMTMYEACSLGTPVITINQVQEQEDEASFLSERKAILNAGMHDNFSENLNACYEQILRKSERERYSLSSRSMIDGMGRNRIVNIILGIGSEGE